jgi:isoleucyl-tRNA synthetase
VRRVVALGRAARTDAKIRVRQPLRRALVVLPRAEMALLSGLEPLIAEELNVKEIESVRGLEELVSYVVKPNFKSLGPRFGARVKAVAAALAATDARSVVRSLEERGAATIDVDGSRIELDSADLDVRIEGREGFALAQDGAYGVALDVEINDELRSEGIAREIVRAVQDLRKSSGLAVEDRIELWLSSEAHRGALIEHRDFIANEVLATSVVVGEQPPKEAATATLSLEGADVAIALRVAG